MLFFYCRHIPVDMAAFAVNVHMLTSKPKVRMGFKPDGVKRSVPGYLEPDFLKSLGASRSTVECRGASDEVRKEGGREGDGGGRGEGDGGGREWGRRGEGGGMGEGVGREGVRWGREGEEWGRGGREWGRGGREG